MAKAQFIGVSGVARKIKNEYVGISGVARKVKAGWAGVGGVARQYFYAGTPLSSLAIGSTVPIKENGVPADYMVVQQGKPIRTEDDLGYDGSCDGTWLLRKQVITSMQFHSQNQTAAYADSLVHAYLNGEYLSLFKAAVQSGIKQVKIPYYNNGSDRILYANSNGLTTKAFVLSMTEVGLHGPAGCGVLLAYFTYDSDSEANEARIAYNSAGEPKIYFSRDPDRNRVLHISNYGEDGFAYSTNSYYVRPCIILPSDFAIEDLII